MREYIVLGMLEKIIMFKKTNTNAISCCIQAEICSFAQGVNNSSAASKQESSVITKTK